RALLDLLRAEALVRGEEEEARDGRRLEDDGVVARPERRGAAARERLRHRALGDRLLGDAVASGRDPGRPAGAVVAEARQRDLGPRVEVLDREAARVHHETELV